MKLLETSETAPAARWKEPKGTRVVGMERGVKRPGKGLERRGKGLERRKWHINGMERHNRHERREQA